MPFGSTQKAESGHLTRAVETSRAQSQDLAVDAHLSAGGEAA